MTTSNAPTIRAARPGELELFASWAEREGWQPGIGDIEAFHRTDPEGFLVAVDGDRVVGTASTARYDGQFAFFGFYMVAPDRRGQGIGHLLYRARLARDGDRPLGLDGVPEQITSYEENGFRVRHWTPRWSGSAVNAVAGLGSDTGVRVERVTASSPVIDELIDFDARHVPAPRGRFVRTWLDSDSPRISFVATEGGLITGYATVRPTLPQGSRVGPLFADDHRTAEALMRACAEAALDWPGIMSIDVPEPNAQATALMERLGFAISFTCARMYRGEVRPLPLDRIYGNTTYELG